LARKNRPVTNSARGVLGPNPSERESRRRAGELGGEKHGDSAWGSAVGKRTWVGIAPWKKNREGASRRGRGKKKSNRAETRGGAGGESAEGGLPNYLAHLFLPLPPS